MVYPIKRSHNQHPAEVFTVSVMHMKRLKISPHTSGTFPSKTADYPASSSIKSPRVIMYRFCPSYDFFHQSRIDQKVYFYSLALKGFKPSGNKKSIPNKTHTIFAVNGRYTFLSLHHNDLSVKKAYLCTI